MTEASEFRLAATARRPHLSVSYPIGGYIRDPGQRLIDLPDLTHN